MVALEAWFDRDAEYPTIVRTAEELDVVLDTITAWPRPSILQLLIAGDLGRAVLDVGLDGAHSRGVLYCSGEESPNGCASQGADAAEMPPIYYYMGSDTEYPSTAEISSADVRRARVHDHRGRTPDRDQVATLVRLPSLNGQGVTTSEQPR